MCTEPDIVRSDFNYTKRTAQTETHTLVIRRANRRHVARILDNKAAISCAWLWVWHGRVTCYQACNQRDGRRAPSQRYCPAQDGGSLAGNESSNVSSTGSG